MRGNTLLAFADGACKPNPGAAAVGAAVFDRDGREVWRGSVYLGERFQVGDVLIEQATNQTAELAAVVFVLGYVPDGVPVVVHTDSAYVVGLVGAGWKAKANRELVALVRRVVAQRGARVEWCPGHCGVVGNVIADRLAAVELERNDRAGDRAARSA